MADEDRLYGEFLEQMQGLEEFRRTYQKRNPLVPLDREDPQLARLLEAMAFFSVQTRRAAVRNLRATHYRLFASYFPTLLTPVPAMLMVQAEVTKLTERKVLPRGSAVQVVRVEDGSVGHLRTTEELVVLPVRLRRTQVIPRERGGYRMAILFSALDARREAPGRVRLHVRHLDDYASSLRALYDMRAHFERAFVVYDQPVGEDSIGDACEVRWGARADVEDEAPPLERIRRFFHFPEADLFLHVDVARPEREWRSFTICIDLDRDWPRLPSLQPDLFVPFVVPAENLRRDTAEPILVDGTRAWYTILPPVPGREWALHSATGVYEVAKRGLVPLRAGELPDPPAGTEAAARAPCEIEQPLAPGEPHRLLVRMPEAFGAPRTVVVEGLWYQPELSDRIEGVLDVSLPGRHIEGIHFRVLGAARHASDGPLRYDSEGLLAMLALKMKSTLGADELTQVLDWLGALRSPFHKLPARLREVTARLAPDPSQRGGGIRHIYRLQMEPWDEPEEALVWAFLARVRQLLDDWNAEAMVEIELDAGGGRPALPLDAAEGDARWTSPRGL